MRNFFRRKVRPRKPDIDTMLSCQTLRERLHMYGFIETGDIINILDSLNVLYPDRITLHFIRGRLSACLAEHDNGEDYFIPLRQLACEIDFVLMETK